MRELTLEYLNAKIIDLETEANNANHRVTSLYARNTQQQLRIKTLEDDVKELFVTLDRVVNPSLYS
jgi:hypothetical protein